MFFDYLMDSAVQLISHVTSIERWTDTGHDTRHNPSCTRQQGSLIGLCRGLDLCLQIVVFDFVLSPGGPEVEENETAISAPPK